MIGLRSSNDVQDDEALEPQGFDDFELTLGDVMRGERATMGKTLEGVEIDLRIKQRYIEAIESADPSVFETPGFIAGFVKSYAKYLQLDPDWAFRKFCEESGFETAHGMSHDALPLRAQRAQQHAAKLQGSAPQMGLGSGTYLPSSESIWSQIDVRALGSSLILLGLIVALGYGAWSVIQEVQRVQLAPIEQTPVIAADIDPLLGAGEAGPGAGIETAQVDNLDRIFRPAALETPLVDQRDGPIAQLSTSSSTPFVSQQPSSVDLAVAEALGVIEAPQILEEAPAQIELLAVAATYVTVSAYDGTLIQERLMVAGERFVIPQTEVPASLLVGDSSAIYVHLDGEVRGPMGNGSVVTGIEMSEDNLASQYAVAAPRANPSLQRYFAQLVTDGGN